MMVLMIVDGVASQSVLRLHCQHNGGVKSSTGGRRFDLSFDFLQERCLAENGFHGREAVAAALQGGREGNEGRLS